MKPFNEDHIFSIGLGLLVIVCLFVMVIIAAMYLDYQKDMAELQIKAQNPCCECVKKDELK